MKKRVLFSGFLLLFFVLQSCCGCEDEPAVKIPEKPVLTFAVVGHAYGNAETFTRSIYPPFLKKFREDHKAHPYDFLFLTGDVVAEGTDANWGKVKDELDSLAVWWMIAPGNHDVGDRAEYIGGKMFEVYDPSDTVASQLCNSDNHWGYKQKYRHIGERDGRTRFLVLNTTNPGWTVDSLQRKWLIQNLAGINKDSVDQLFVFTHQLWWQNHAPDSLGLDSIRTNSEAAKAGPSDFWQDVFPYFARTGVETWFFAGDLGAHHSLPFYYEDHYKKYHFYASGVGGGVGDSYFRVSVYQYGSVEIERVVF